MRAVVHDWMTIVGAIAIAIMVWQGSRVAAEPNYGLTNGVVGSSRVADGTNRIADYLPSLAGDQLSAGTLTQNRFGLPAMVQLLEETGTHASEAGLSATAALSALVAGNSGSSGALFASVLQTIDDALGHLGQHLPTTKATLLAMLGPGLPDRLTDGFGRVESGLTRLRALVVTLRNAIAAAIAEAGSESSVSADTLQRHVTLSLVYQLADAVFKLRAYLPVVRYTLTSSIEDALTADTFLAAYQTTVDSVASLVNLFVDPLDTAQAAFYNDLAPRVQALEGAFGDVQQNTQLLAMIQVPALSAAIDAMLAAYALALGDVDADLAAVDQELQQYIGFVEQLLANPDTELVDIDDSALIHTLVFALISCGRYSRYCFHKYQHLVADLINALLERTTLCVEREVRRLANLQLTTASLLENTRHDIDDVSDLLFVCDAILDETDRDQCVMTISDSITPLGAVFADKYDLLYELTGTELAASKQRIQMCVGVTERLFADRYIPDLRAEIDSCVADGPNPS